MTDDSVLSTTRALSIQDAGSTCARIIDALESVIVGKRAQLELVLSGLLANGHMLLEDLPGLGKTLIARSLAQVTGLTLGRVQFTPDLMPADVTGSLIYDQRRQDFDFRPGPIFHNLVLGDEINRAPPKTQASLLEAMQERQVTVDGVSHPLPAPFIVLATQNPIEFEGTYPLPEAQIDRFLLRMSIGYPSRADDAEIIRRRLHRRTDTTELDAVVDGPTVLALQTSAEDVLVSDPVIVYCVSLVHATRESTQVSAGASPRGVEALVKLPGPGRYSIAAATSRPTMSRRSPYPHWRIGSCFGPSCGFGAAMPNRSWPRCSSRCRHHRHFRPIARRPVGAGTNNGDSSRDLPVSGRGRRNRSRGSHRRLGGPPRCRCVGRPVACSVVPRVAETSTRIDPCDDRRLGRPGSGRRRCRSHRLLDRRGWVGSRQLPAECRVLAEARPDW